MALRFKDYTFNSSGHRVENCSSRYSFLNDERYFINQDILFLLDFAVVIAVIVVALIVVGGV